ncbi:DeoR family transcriptional regulator [Streptomyces sp. NPDC057362]|uniref:DeoR family transcriptional regulator n=1 Tax=Streptomyces sp. NPDC057362 TaxID=3346106 RepID=UPI003643088A
MSAVETRLRQRRARVRQLQTQGRSLRDIAAEVGVSKDTVRRDLAALEAPAAKADEQLLLVVVDEQLRKDLNLLAASYRLAGEDAARLVLHQAAEGIRRTIAARVAATGSVLP